MDERREGTTRLRDIRRENLARPLSRAQIDALPPAGDRSVAFDLSGLSLRLDTLDEALDAAARERFSAYLCDPALAPSPLRVTVHTDSVPYYVEPERTRSEGYYRLRIVHGRGLIRLVTYSMAAWIDLGAWRAGVAFGTGSFDPQARALENFCRVAVAWTALSRGGFLIHGASVERGGRAYVFFGKSASGKSTLARVNTEGRVISDDLTLVLPTASGLAAAGSPFRGTYEGGEPVRGLFPLAGLFRLVQDDRTFAETPPRVNAFAEFLANLPFVNEALDRYRNLFDALEAGLSAVPILDLHFTRTPDYWPAVDGALAGSPDR